MSGGEVRQATRVEGGDIIALAFIPNELGRHHNILITKAIWFDLIFKRIMLAALKIDCWAEAGRPIRK